MRAIRAFSLKQGTGSTKDERKDELQLSTQHILSLLIVLVSNKANSIL